MKTTLILGASLTEGRISNEALILMQEQRIPVFAFGREKGMVGSVEIDTERRKFNPGEIDTVGMYLRAENQAAFENWILEMRPRRIFFNPGAENPAFSEKLLQAGVECRNECMITCINKDEY